MRNINTLDIFTSAVISVRLFFYFLDYVTHRSEKLGFKKQYRILPDTTMELFIFGLIRNHRENYFETSLSFCKLHKNFDKWGPYLCFLFCDCRSKNFTSCNVFQQQKNPLLISVKKKYISNKDIFR